MFDLDVSYPPIEQPQYLIALNPVVIEAEQARVRERFESAVELAEQAFATDLQRFKPHLAERLTGLQDGQPKVFRDTAIRNFTEFFDRSRRLNVRSNPGLDALVDQARQVITGIEPQQLRESVRPCAMGANDFTRIEQVVGDVLVDRPRRIILRRAGAGSGGTA